MNDEQKKLLAQLELGLANLVHDKQDELAKPLGIIVEYLQKGEPVIAVLEGEAMNFSSQILDCIRKTFDVRW